MIRFDVTAATGNPVRRAPVLEPTQEEIFPRILYRPQHVDGMTDEQIFAAFHRANPAVYAWLKARAQEMVDAKCKRISVRMLWEVLRYRVTIHRVVGGYRLNNNLAPRYARMLAAETWMPQGTVELRRADV
jgi:hypothetical protein